jgi:TonB family protein
VPLDPVDAVNGGGRTYAVAFETFSASPGRLSGTLTLFAGSERYDVPFSNVIAVPATSSGALTAVPLTVRFTTAVKVDAAYLSAIVGPNPGPCGLGYIAMRSNDGVRARELSELDRVLRARVQDVKPIDAPASVSDRVTCERPNVDASIAFSATPRYPDLAGRRGDMGETQVAVALAADNAILAAWVWKSSGSKDLDQAAVIAARASRFNAATFRCQRVFGLYTFYADFQE